MINLKPAISTIELFKENMKFSIAHFTIFSANERENLHGHNYTVSATLDVELVEDGLAFDYRFYKQKLRELCRELNQTTLLPTQSRYLKVVEEGDYYCAYFAQEKILFLKRDVTLVPLANITVEELACWFIAKLTANAVELKTNHVSGITIKVFSGPGQGASVSWTEEHGSSISQSN